MRKKIDEWAKFAAKDIIFSKINVFGAKNLSFNLAIDKYITSFASCFRSKTFNNLYIPSLQNLKFNEN
jgi:hypothetical protein